MPAGGTLSVAASRRGGRSTSTSPTAARRCRRRERAHVFEPFATADAQRGANLGLAVARGLLRSRGGDLLYRPRKDGNVFRVVLRVATGTR